MQVPHTEITIRGAEGAVLLQKIVPPGEYVLGREPAAELCVEAELVSRRHAQLTINYDHALIEDLGSSNGTLVNGKAVTEPTRLWPNQKIQVGAATVELRRVKSVPPPDVSLAPAQATVQRLLPEELLRDKKYAIGGVIAQGGMGAILDAKDSATERIVAMKVMLDGSSPDDLTRFVAEAKVTAQLEHPNIVPVHELSVDENGQPFYTMKMVLGITLKKVLDLLTEGTEATVKKYPLSALLTIYQKLCDAVAFAHSKGVIHRDLKPENVMLGDFGEVLVMDWGLAKRMKDEGGRMKRSEPSAGGGEKANARSAQDASSFIPHPSSFSLATLAGTIMGTPQYMSPEQARGEVEDLDVRSDLYALGAILYHLLALRPPVTGRTAMEIVDKVGRGDVEPLVVGRVSPRAEGSPQGGALCMPPTAVENRRSQFIPDSLAAVVRKAMAFEREQRYGSVEELQADLTAYQSGFATSAERAGAWKQITLLIKRHKATSIGIAAVLLVGAALGSKAVIEGHRAERALAALKKTAPTMVALAQSEAGFQRFDSALDKLDAALALDPALGEARWQRTWVLLGQQRWAEAAEALRHAPQNDAAQRERAGVLPQIERLAAMSDAKREGSAEARSVVSLLQRVGASGPATALVTQLKLGREAQLAVVRQRLVEWLGPEAASRAVFGLRGGVALSVDLSKLAVTSIEPLSGLPVEELVLEESRVASLEGARGMPLRQLWINKTPITDLRPIAGAPLQELYAIGTNLSDITPLRGMPLTRIECAVSKISDLSPLRGTRLTWLNLINNPVSDLSPLAGMSLSGLDIGGTGVLDLSLLRGMPITKLGIHATRVSDLSPLRGMPIRELDMQYCSAAIDLGILLDLPELEKLAITEGNPTMEKLRRHPKLRLIQFQHTGVPPPSGYQPIEQFWAEYDAQQAASKK